MTTTGERFQIDVAGKNYTFEVGSVAKQANGATLVRLGDTVVLVTAVMAKKPREGADFFPLTVDYRERTYAAGRIPGGFFKREGRARETEILSCRLTDRSIRPLFPDGFRNDVQITALTLSADEHHSPEILVMLGASVSLATSDIPWSGPLAAVRLGLVEDRFVVNPTFEELGKSELDMVVAGKKGAILMVETGSREVSEEKLLEALALAQKEIDRMCDFQNEIVQKVGKTKTDPPAVESLPDLNAKVDGLAREGFKEAVRIAEKGARDKKVSDLCQTVQEKLATEFPEKEGLIAEQLGNIEYEEARKLILDEKKRTDGRSFEEVRPITCQTGVLPRTHGSALFTRGQTQSLATVTLGAPADQQIMDELQGEYRERFLLHYNFPGFSTGEPKPERGPGRREMGHGALARRALRPVLPPEEDFPYTIRVVSDILESNGSSSMASVCGGSLAMFDAGVPLKNPVAGIAMGLVKEGDRAAVLTDIMGMEDHLGDMDFKVAGTVNGVTALQMDIKIEGISQEIMKTALEQAKQARLFVLEAMNQKMDKPKEMSPYAPRMVTLQIPVDKIGALIGPGGKNIRRIIEESGAQVDVEDDGRVYISTPDGSSLEMARDMVSSMVAEVEVGKIYKGRVVRIMPRLGAFVEVLPGKEGLVHISQLDVARVERIEDVVNLGDELEVKCLEIDNQGRVNLSRKAVIKPGSELESVRPSRRPDDRGPRGGHRGRSDDRGRFRGGGRPRR